MKDKFVKAYMDTAERFAQLSTAKRLQVGAIVVKDDRIISIGYNGTPSGWHNECEETLYEELEDGTLVSCGTKTRSEVLHAEANAIAKLARSSESGEGATLFVTHAPCLECAKLIYQIGISQLYYKNDYRLSAGLDFLFKTNIGVHKVE